MFQPAWSIRQRPQQQLVEDGQTSVSLSISPSCIYFKVSYSLRNFSVVQFIPSINHYIRCDSGSCIVFRFLNIVFYLYLRALLSPPFRSNSVQSLQLQGIHIPIMAMNRRLTRLPEIGEVLLANVFLMLAHGPRMILHCVYILPHSARDEDVPHFEECFACLVVSRSQ